MPVYSLQHRYSTGQFENHRSRGYRKQKTSASALAGNRTYDTSDNYSFISQIMRGENAHIERNRLDYQPPHHRQSAVATATQFLLLLSQINPVNPPPLIPAHRERGSLCQIPDPHSYNGIPSLSAPWQTLKTALSEAGEYLEQYYTLRFPAADAAVLPSANTTLPKALYDLSGSQIGQDLFRELVNPHGVNNASTGSVSPVIIFTTRTNTPQRKKRAEETALKNRQDTARRNYIASHCHIRTKPNDGQVTGNFLLVSGETVRNTIRVFAEKFYKSRTGGHELPEGLVKFTEASNIVMDLLLGIVTLGAYPIFKYAAAKALKTSGQLLKGDSQCIQNEFTPEELATLLFDIESGITHHQTFKDFPFRPKPAELQKITKFRPDGMFVLEDVANKVSTVKYITLDYQGVEYHTIEIKPDEYWATYPLATHPELMEKRVWFDEIHNKIHFSSDMPDGHGLNYRIIDGKRFIIIHGDDHEFFWNWDKKRPEVTVRKLNGEILNIPVYMEPLSKKWHLSVNNEQATLSQAQDLLIKSLSYAKGAEFRYIPRDTNNAEYYGNGKIYFQELIDDAGHYMWGRYIEINGHLVPLRNQKHQGKGALYEVFDVKKPEAAGYAVEWDSNLWIFERSTSTHVSDKVASFIHEVTQSSAINREQLSAPDSKGLRWDNPGKAYIKIDNRYFKMEGNADRWTMLIPGKKNIAVRLNYGNHQFGAPNLHNYQTNHLSSRPLLPPHSDHLLLRKPAKRIKSTATLAELVSDNVIQRDLKGHDLSRASSKGVRRDIHSQQKYIQIKDGWVEIHKIPIGIYIDNNGSPLRIQFFENRCIPAATAKGYSAQVGLYKGEQATALVHFQGGEIVTIPVNSEKTLTQNLLEHFDAIDDGIYSDVSKLHSEKKDLFCINKITLRKSQTERTLFYSQKKQQSFDYVEKLFDSTPVDVTDPLKILVTPNDFIAGTTRYETPAGNLHVMQQGTMQSCGYTCAAMVAKDIKASKNPIDNYMKMKEGAASGVFQPHFPK